MTGTEVSVETQAHRIAARGRDALVERLRSAYGDAAAAHADLISLDDERIEAMVQSAADRADGLQWRRALADVAAEELGITAQEAVSHAAVVRAQMLAGAPSYEQSLAELIAQPVPPADGTPQARVPQQSPQAAAPDASRESVSAVDSRMPATVEHQAVEIAKSWPPAEARSDELEAVEADDVVLELLPEPDPIEYETELYDVEAAFTEEQAPPTLEPEPFVAPDSEPVPHAAAVAASEPMAPAAATAHAEPTTEHEAASAVGPDTHPEPASRSVSESAAPAAAAETPDELVIPAIHLGGVANLPTKRDGLSVRLSADGLDILQGAEHEILGRLVWEEIEALEVPHLRPRRRQKQVRARMIVRTPHGDASFEVPEISPDELRDRVEPLMRLHGQR